MSIHKLDKWKNFISASKDREQIPILEQLIEFGGSRTSNRALDLGSGAGIEAKALAEAGFHVDAIDSSLTAVQHTKKTCKNLDVRVVRIDAKEFRIQENNYAIIISRNILSYLPKRSVKQVLRDIKKGLVRGGVCFVTLFGAEDELNKAKTRSGKSFWTLQEVESILADMSYVKIAEKKWSGQTALKRPKFWHVIYVTARH